jgi:signal transduction histidine kinase
MTADEAAPANQSRRIVGHLLTAILVCLLVILSVAARNATGLPPAFWPAGAVAAAAWMRSPRTPGFHAAYAALLTLVFAIGNFMSGRSDVESLVFTLGNMLDVGLAVWMVRRFLPQLDFSSVNGQFRYLLLAPIAAPVPAALLIGGLGAYLDRGSFRNIAEYWWLSHAISFAVITPLCLCLNRQSLAPLAKPTRAIEAVVLMGLIAAVAVYAFNDPEKSVQILLTPLILAAAVRLRVVGAAAAVTVATLGAIWGAGMAVGGADDGLAPEQRMALVHNLQLWTMFGFLPALPVAALLDERDRLAEAAQRGQIRAEAASLGKSRLLANVAHEIKSPAAGVIGIGEMMATGKLGPVNAMQEEMAQVVTDTARQIESLAYDLLDVAQAEAGTVQLDIRPVPLAGLAEDVQRKMAGRPDAAKIKWRIEGKDESCIAMGDSVRLAQILTHLVSNAVKYGGSGGLITIRLSDQPGDRVRLEVIDNGPGIALQRQSELFEPFNRLGMEKSTIEGHGIGLALVKRLVELMRGSVGFDSDTGRGARFWADLPAAPR